MATSKKEGETFVFRKDQLLDGKPDTEFGKWAHKK